MEDPIALIEISNQLYELEKYYGLVDKEETWIAVLRKTISQPNALTYFSGKEISMLLEQELDGSEFNQFIAEVDHPYPLLRGARQLAWKDEYSARLIFDQIRLNYPELNIDHFDEMLIHFNHRPEEFLRQYQDASRVLAAARVFMQTGKKANGQKMYTFLRNNYPGYFEYTLSEKITYMGGRMQDLPRNMTMEEYQLAAGLISGLDEDVITDAGGVPIMNLMGRLLNEDLEPLEGIKVWTADAPEGIMTDSEGRFSFEVSATCKSIFVDYYFEESLEYAIHPGKEFQAIIVFQEQNSSSN